MGLAVEERERFLAEPHIAALAVAEPTERAPLNVPIWYQYEPGGELWFVTGATSRKARLIERAGRISLMVQRITPTVRYVSVEGPVTRIEPVPDGSMHEMAARYLPAEMVDGYLQIAEAEHGEQVLVAMSTERWLSADLGAF